MAVAILPRGEVPERLNGPVLKTGARKCRGFESHPLRQATIAILGVLAVVGCSVFSRTFDFSIPAEGNRDALPVVLHDETGQVAALGEAPANAIPVLDNGLLTLRDNPNALVIHWTGGVCDTGALITATGSDQLTFTLKITTRPGECILIGVSRSVLVLLTHPVDMSRTSFRFQR